MEANWSLTEFIMVLLSTYGQSENPAASLKPRLHLLVPQAAPQRSCPNQCVCTSWLKLPQQLPTVRKPGLPLPSITPHCYPQGHQ